MADMGAYRIRFLGDLGNASQFTAGLVGMASTVKNSWRNMATGQVPANLRSPSINVGNLTTSVDAANKVLITSGQVFNRVVVGWTADLQKLDAANARSAANTANSARIGAAAGPQALNYNGAQFASPATPSGASVYGTGVNAQNVPGVYANQLTPIYENIPVGEFTQIQGNVEKITAATKSLIPMEEDLANIDKQAQLGILKNSAIYQTLLEQQTQQLKQQVALKRQLSAAYTTAGGSEPIYNPSTGALVNPGVLNAKTSEITALMNSPVYQKLKATLSTPGALGLSDLVDAQGNPILTQGESTPISTKDFRAIVSADVANQQSGTIATVEQRAQGIGQADLQLATAQIRLIPQLEESISQGDVLLGEIGTKLDQSTAATKAYATKIAAQKANIQAAYAPQTQALVDAYNTPQINAQLDATLAKSKDFRNQLTKALQINAPYGTQAFAQQLNQQLTSVDVNKDLNKGLTQIKLNTVNAAGEEGQFTAAIGRNNEVVQKMSGGYRNAGSALGQISMDFKKVLEWTVATTVVFGAFGAAIGTISKINAVNMDLQRFQIVAKTTGQETKDMFNAVADIAYKTATPLTELTTVMDDIALATRKAGQTTVEWMTDMKALTEAVGIFTNIAGVDTTKATDLLSAAFKQLEIAPTALIGIMDKVTAVSGGNAQAEQDIISALGTVAEAAKASMMSVDEQIAAVQVLSQVTNKTPADLATSFKNLFGAISSPASVKELAKFNIDVRDTQGNLRGFVPIYQDIYNAIQKGVIPSGQIQDVLRAIAGGPRRAPDAAAVLGNWPKIMATVETSANATNDALIANAKIVDTNSAKLQQLGTAFETALVNQFSDAITNLVGEFTGLAKVIGDVLNVFNLGGGNFLGSVSTSIIKFAALAAGIIILTKALGGLRSGLGGVAASLGLLNMYSKTSTLFGNATVNATGAYTTAIPLNTTERNGYTQTVLPLVAGQTQKYTYTPPENSVVRPQGFVGPLTPVGIAGAAQEVQAPESLVASPSILGSLGALLQNSRGARLGVGALGGAALGLGLGAASQATGNGTFSSIGQTLGLMGILSFQPELMAAGALTTVISTLFQTWQDGAEKAKAAQATLQSSVYDSIKALSANQSTYDTAKQDQTDAIRIINDLGNKTNKTSDDTLSLNDANEKYISSTLDVMTAEKGLADSRDKLLQQLAQLKEYADIDFSKLITNAMGLDPDMLKLLSGKISQNLLQQAGTFTAGGYAAFQRLTPLTTHILAPTEATQGPSVFGRLQGGGSPNLQAPMDSSEFIKQWLSMSSEDAANAVMDFLKGPTTFTAMRGVTVDPNLTAAIDMFLQNATADQKNTDTYKEATQIFQNSVMTLAGALSPQQIMNQNLAGYQARAQANAAFGIDTTTEAANAAARQSIAQQMIDLSKNLPINTTQDMRGEGQNYPGQIGSNQVFQMLYGPKGFAGNGTEYNKTPITADEAKNMFATIEKLDPALKDAQKNTALFGELTYRYFKAAGVEVDGLHDASISLQIDLQSIQDDLDKARESGLSNLYDQINTLQAQYQGGQFKDNPQDYTAQMAQLKGLAGDWDTLTTAFQVNTASMPDLASALSTMQAFKKLDLKSVFDPGDTTTWNNLLTVLMEVASTYGLNSKQAKQYTDDLINMAAASVAVQTAQQNVAVAVGEIQTAFGNLNFSGIIKGMVDLATAEQAGAKSVADVKKYKADLTAVLASGAGSSFGNTPTGSAAAAPSVGKIDLDKVWQTQSQQSVAAMLKESVAWAKKYQSQIPGEDKAHANDIVAVMEGNTRVLLQKGIKEEYLTTAIDNNTTAINNNNALLAKADTIRRIRVGAGDFAALANVPVNSQTGISTSGPQGPITISLNITGQVLTKAQIDQFGNSIAAAFGNNLGTSS